MIKTIKNPLVAYMCKKHGKYMASDRNRYLSEGSKVITDCPKCCKEFREILNRENTMADQKTKPETTPRWWFTDEDGNGI